MAKKEEAVLLLCDDGDAFMCSECCATVQRTRDNLYPEPRHTATCSRAWRLTPRDHQLPIPAFRSVRNVVPHHKSNSVSLIVPDHDAGKLYRYNVVRLYLGIGRALVTGRELPLKLAREVAARGPEADGKPLRGVR